MDRQAMKKQAAVMAVLAFLEEERDRKTKNTWVHSGRKMAMNNRNLAQSKL